VGTELPLGLEVCTVTIRESLKPNEYYLSAQAKKTKRLEAENARLRAELAEHKKWQNKLQKLGSMLVQPSEDSGHQLVGHRKFRDAFAHLVKDYFKNPSTLLAEGAQEERIQSLSAELAEAREAVRAFAAWDVAESGPLEEFGCQDRVALYSWAKHLSEVVINGKAKPFKPPRHGINILTNGFVESSEEQCKALVDAAMGEGDGDG
jgi:hypothetical protein